MLLKKRIRELISELEQLLASEDPRWDAFGLNAPGAPETPEAPDNLILTPGTPGHVLADWSDARRVTAFGSVWRGWMRTSAPPRR
jgi:hypothetical protein